MSDIQEAIEKSIVKAAYRHDDKGNTIIALSDVKGLILSGKEFKDIKIRNATPSEMSETFIDWKPVFSRVKESEVKDVSLRG